MLLLKLARYALFVLGLENASAGFILTSQAPFGKADGERNMSKGICFLQFSCIRFAIQYE